MCSCPQPRLSLHSLSLRSLPSDLPALSGLKCLSVGGSPNSLAEVPDSVAALTCLEHLKLHGCHMLPVSAWVPHAAWVCVRVAELSWQLTARYTPVLKPTHTLAARLHPLTVACLPDMPFAPLCRPSLMQSAP